MLAVDGLSLLVMLSVVVTAKMEMEELPLSSVLLDPPVASPVAKLIVKTPEHTAGPILIKDQGVMPLRREDMVLIFYLTVLNNGHGPVELRASMKQCCQHFSVQDAECESMLLIGGYMGILSPSHTTNITLLYPNLYIYNRVGECEITIQYSDHSFQHTIHFNTTISRYGPVSSVMEDYYSPLDVSTCPSVDQDPLDSCSAVNCFHKYNGHRNYFNPSKLRCTPVPRCDSARRGAGSLPTMAYVPESNQCRQLMTSLSEEDLQFFHDSAKGEVLRYDKDRPQTVECHHGRADEELWCVCDKGWMSSPLDRASFQTSSSVYHMCNIKVVKPADEAAQNRAASNWLFTLAIGSVLVGLICIALTLYCVQWWMDHRHRQGASRSQSEERLPLTGDSPSGSEASLTSDLSQRRKTPYYPRASTVSRRPSVSPAKSVRISSRPTVYGGERRASVGSDVTASSGTE